MGNESSDSDKSYTPAITNNKSNKLSKLNDKTNQKHINALEHDETQSSEESDDSLNNSNSNNDESSENDFDNKDYLNNKKDIEMGIKKIKHKKVRVTKEKNINK